MLQLRLVTVFALVVNGIHETCCGDALSITLALLKFCTAALILAGLWTSAGSATAILLGLFAAVVRPVNIWECILIVNNAVAMAMLGPGAWSVDARLFGWKRIRIGDPNG